MPRNPAQRHFRAPPFPGAAAFDLDENMQQLATAKRHRTNPPCGSMPKRARFSADDPLSWSPDVYHTRVMTDLDTMAHAVAARELVRVQSIHPGTIGILDSEFTSQHQAGSVDATSPVHARDDYNDLCGEKAAAADDLPMQQAGRPTLDDPLTRNMSDMAMSTTLSGHIIHGEYNAPINKNCSVGIIPTKHATATAAPLGEAFENHRPRFRLPISEQELIIRLQGIYAGLMITEKKCVDIVREHSQSGKHLHDQQWKALVALHRTLLQENHDFLTASQHPSAPLALRSLATKYAMPTRLWKHGLRPFLELLFHRLPNPAKALASFGQDIIKFLNSLKLHVPSMSDEWQLVTDNLQEYFLLLRASGIEISDPVINYVGGETTIPNQMRRTLSSFIRSFWWGREGPPNDSFGDFVDGPLELFPESAEIDDDMGDDAPEVASMLLKGWLELGTSIAISSHAYISVSIFLFCLAVTAWKAS